MIDPSFLQGAASTFATLVGLICNWRQERGQAQAESFQEFMTWLLGHNFEKLHGQILGSEELQLSLHDLLRQDTAELSSKLDVACSALASISGKIDALAPIVTALRAERGGVSSQASDILKYFADSGAQYMVEVPGGTPVLFFIPSGAQISLSEGRFLADDIAALLAFGFIRIAKYNADGKPVYSLTRSGLAFANQLPAVDVREEG